MGRISIISVGKMFLSSPLMNCATNIPTNNTMAIVNPIRDILGIPCNLSFLIKFILMGMKPTTALNNAIIVVTNIQLNPSSGKVLKAPITQSTKAAASTKVQMESSKTLTTLPMRLRRVSLTSNVAWSICTLRQRFLGFLS